MSENFEINDRDLESVSGGEAWSSAWAEFQRVNCSDCKRGYGPGDRPSCMQDALFKFQKAGDDVASVSMRCRRKK